MAIDERLLHRLAEGYGSFAADNAASADPGYVPTDVRETIALLADACPGAAEAARRSYIDRVRLNRPADVSPETAAALADALTPAAS
ncbi:hypothetical protein [Tsukamurella sp. 1534]|uniref:hypothetical protein n=1 Tax=Tsukamurella sp. 1534 TaxID=1151061 RepID=UPI0005945702|nr:hypothetical protein [Tsukamurella sp. 1534]